MIIKKRRKMKDHINKLLLLFTFVSICACSDYLDESPRALQTVDGAFLEAGTAELVVNGMYDALAWGESTSIGFSGHSYEFIFGDICTDDAEKGSTAADQIDIQRLKEFNTNGNNGNISTTWGKYWVAINRANVVLSKIPDSPINQNIKDRFEGEAKFVRGFSYMQLVTIFGGVPIFESPVGSDQISERNFSRASISEVYELIDRDLNDAISLLSIKGNTTIGRANKGAAAAYLARSYMYQIGTDNTNGHNWQEVFDLTNEIMTGVYGNYALANNYAEIWSIEGENNMESIWEIQAVDNGIDNFERGPSTGSMWSQFAAPFFMGGWGFNTPTVDLAEAYEPNDPRRPCTALAVGEHAFGVEMEINERCLTGYYPRKFILDPELWVTLKGSALNIRKFRLADIILMNAEAAYHTGNTAQAVENIVKIRERASNSTYPQGYDPNDPYGYPTTGFVALDNTSIPQSGQALLDFIYLERRRELGMEQLRFMDLVRTGRYFDAIQNKYVDLGNPTDTDFANRVTTSAMGKSVQGTANSIPLFPIPTRELEDWGLTQNPGY